MACVNPDGSVSAVAQKVLRSLGETGAPQDAAKAAGLPLYRVRASLRELVAAGLLEQQQGRYVLTEAGAAAAAD